MGPGRERDHLFMQWMFLSLYAHFREVREFVHQIEKRVRDATEEHLAQVHKYVKAVVKDAQNHNFKVSNVVGILTEVGHMMSPRRRCALANSAWLPTGFDDKAFIDFTSREEALCP